MEGSTPTTPLFFPAYQRATGVPVAGPRSPSSLQREGAEAQRTPWPRLLNKQAQGGHRGGGGCNPVERRPCDLGWPGPVLHLLERASTK